MVRNKVYKEIDIGTVMQPPN